METRRDTALANVLESNRREIVDAWIELKLQQPITTDFGIPLDQLKNATERQYGTVIEILILGTDTAQKAFHDGVCHTYWHISPFAVMEVSYLLRDAAIPVLRREYEGDAGRIWAALIRLEHCLRWIVGQHMNYYIAETQRSLQVEQARSVLVPEIAHLASRSLELDVLLRGVAKGIAKAAGVNYCGFFLVDESQGTIHPQFHVTVEPVMNAPVELGGPEPPPQPISAFSAFLSEVVEKQQPLTSYDVQVDPRFENTAPRKLGFRSVLGLPFVVKDRVVAAAYALTFNEYHTFTQEQIDLAMAIANTAGLAIENSQLHQRVHSIAAFEERERLSRELHDNLSQVLGLLKLKTSIVSDLLAVHQIDKAQDNLNEMKNIATEAYTDAREAIFALRMPVASGPDFKPTLCSYLSGYRDSYGVDIHLQADHDTAASMEIDVVAQVIRIIQEALTNVRKHAQVTEAWVSIEREADGVRIDVEDRGLGFDSKRIEMTDLSNFGLDVMRERAESVGGWLTIDSELDQGTRVTAWVPFSNNG